MIGLFVVNTLSISRSVEPCGCKVTGTSLKRSTTLTNRIFSSGSRSRRMAVAASASCVATSPQDAITTSGSTPSSLLARGQMPKPLAQCTIASSIVVNCRCFCLSQTMTLIKSVERRQWSATDSSVLASGGRYTRATLGLLLVTRSMNPGS